MERLTTNKPVSEMGMFELAHNGCYIDENFSARYRDFDTDIDARELTRDIMRGFSLWEIDDDEMLSDEIFDDTIMENLMYGPKELEGLIALFYRNLWAMAELRERLKAYEDLEEQCIKETTWSLRMLLEKWKVFFEDITELLEYRRLKEQGLLLRLPCKVGDTVYYVHKGGIDEVEVDSFVLNVNLFANVSYYIGCDRFGKTLTPYKTLFFTKEEAEQKLAEMGGE